MSKVRVYELAKQLGVENKDLLKVIAGLGIEVKNHMSAVEEDAAAKIVAAVKPPAPKKGDAARKSAPAPKKASAKDGQDHPAERTKPAAATHTPKTAKPSGKAAVAGPAAAGATPKAPGAHRTPAAPAAPAAPSPLEPTAPRGKVRVSIDEIAPPNAMLSGEVVFSDGARAEWFVDETGRLALNPEIQGYRPSQPDVMEFQRELQRLAQSQGL